MTDLPPNVYRLPQRRFDAVPGAPLVYWLSPAIFDAFAKKSRLGSFAIGKHGLSTCDTFRYVRYWWEAGTSRILFGIEDVNQTQSSGNWFPFMKGGERRKWFGNQSLW